MLILFRTPSLIGESYQLRRCFKELIPLVNSVRERYWVQRLNTMWPHGWNSAWPGKPAFSRWARPPPTTTLPPGDENTTQQNYEQLVQKYEKSREEVENHLKLMAKADLRAFLDWVALKSTRTAANNAIELYVLELLNQKPPSKKKAFRTLSGWFPSRWCLQA